MLLRYAVTHGAPPPPSFVCRCVPVVVAVDDVDVAAALCMGAHVVCGLRRVRRWVGTLTGTLLEAACRTAAGICVGAVSGEPCSSSRRLP